MQGRSASPLIFAASLLAGCGGSPCGLCGAPPPPHTSSIVAQPAAVNFPHQQGAQTVTITLSGGTAPYKAVAADARYVDVSAPATAGGVTSFTVSPVAGGTTGIIVTGSAQDAALNIPVSVAVCEPPFPNLFLVYPSNQATVSNSTARIWAAILTTDPFVSGIAGFHTRLVGSDSSVIEGGNFAATTATPPPGSTTPPSSSGGYTYAYDYLTSAIAGLRSGVTYQVQLTLPTYACVPPAMLGSFTTQ